MQRHFISLILLLILVTIPSRADVTVGAARSDVYMPLLKNKRVGLLSNHTGIVDGRHTLDLLLEKGINVTKLFAPEHGFRGTADAGENINSSTDAKTGLPIISLYGKNQTPLSTSLADVDVIVCDLQDVGLRFYTYYITMMRMMEEAARQGKAFVVFDRPNPNGMTVDGPTLDMTLASGVGRLPIPVIHGMTLGELARMIVGENWLKTAKPLKLNVVACKGYTHATRYQLPVAPSPNLPTMKSVYLYPSTCLFEGTIMSLGRGTAHPFEVFGHPSMTGCKYSFTPRSKPGAKNPPLLGKKCYGRSLTSLSDDDIINAELNLQYVIDSYNNPGLKPLRSKFFTEFFDKLIGNRSVRQMIEKGYTADQIRQTWSADVKRFKVKRKPYLLYPEK